MNLSKQYSDKLNGLVLMKEAGLPVLPFFILDKRGNIEGHIKKFIKDNKVNKFCVRIDDISAKMGLNSIIDATLEKDLVRIEELSSRHVVFISHPGNIYRNLHSVNIMKDYNEIVLEAIGPGFITPDMDKKGLLHEQIVFDHNFKQLTRELIVDNKTYLLHRNTKIGSNIDIHKKNNSMLLQYQSYLPLSSDEIEYIKSVFPVIEKVAHNMKYDKFVASLSFIELNKKPEPIFWDLFGITK